MYYEKARRPGFTTTSKSIDLTLGWLVDGLLDELHLNDKDTLVQLTTYKNDKRVEESANSEIVRGKTSVRRRDRHHWDKISALQMALVGARAAPRRYKPTMEENGENVIILRNYTFNEKTKLFKDRHKKREKYWI